MPYNKPNKKENKKKMRQIRELWDQ